MKSSFNFGTKYDNSYDCFLNKISEIKNQHSELLKKFDFDFESLFRIYQEEHGIKYEFIDNFKKLQLDERNEIELSFKEALKSCLDKCSE